ncbi:hypothetical protein J6590_050398 [Homalodisca vitripennis]|nr:hypothetical protein J6590_050398 [Homalodisca vitripennis]
MLQVTPQHLAELDQDKAVKINATTEDQIDTDPSDFPSKWSEEGEGGLELQSPDNIPCDTDEESHRPRQAILQHTAQASRD